MIYILLIGIVGGVLVFGCVLYAIAMRRNMVSLGGSLERTIAENIQIRARAEAALRDVATLQQILAGTVNRPIVILAPDDQMDRLLAKALERLTPSEKAMMN